MNSSKNINKKRIKNIIIFFITLLFILVLRISYITIINGKEYSEDILEYVDMYAKQKLKERSENENVARDCNNKVFALLDRYCELRKIVDYN